MTITVIDGQGGGVGRALIEGIRNVLPEIEIIAAGTNSIATTNMLKAGASAAATGENAVIHCAKLADIIAGPIGIILSDSLFGEVSEKMASATAESSAVKILVPMNKCRVRVAGVEEGSLSFYVSDAVNKIVELAKNNRNG